MKLPGEANVLPIARPVGGVVRGARDPVAPALANAGANMVGAANQLNRAFEAEQLRVDNSRVEDNHTQLVNFKVDLAQGEDGYQLKKGRDAVTKPLLKDTLSKFDRRVADMEGKLDNDRQKEEFRKRVEIVRGQVTQGVLSHQLREDGVYQKDVLKSTIGAETNSAAMSWNVPNEVNGSILRTTEAARKYAKANGLDEKNIILEATTSVHEAVIENAIDSGETEYANQWLKAHRKEIDADVAIRLNGMLKTSETLGNSQAHADRIYSPRKGPEAMLAEARKISNPEERRTALSLLKARISEDEYYFKKDQADALDEGLGYLASRRAAGHAPRLTDIPISVMERMNGAGQDAIMRQLSGVKPVKGGQTYYTLEQMHAADELAFAEVDLNLFDGQITPEEKVKFIGYQKDAVTGGPMGEIARTKSQIIKQGMQAAGLDPKDMDSGDEEIAFQRRIDAEAEALGRDVTATDIRDIVDRLTVEVIRERDYLWDVKTPAGLTTIEGIPDDLIDDLAMAVKNAGQKVTVENIRLLYEYQNR